MVQMAPNSSAVTALVISLETYAAQTNFYIILLEITASKKVADLPQMPGADKGAKVKALLSKEVADDMKLKKGVEVNCEIKKVSPDLWRIGTITAGKQKKK